VFLAQSWQGYDLLRRLGRTRIFEKDSNTPEKRLNRLYNQSKHAESVIERREMPEHATIPVWLTNKGLKSHDTELSFVEAAEILKVLGTWATRLQDPLTFAEQLRGGEFSDHGEAP
jgi:hypothetical protein